MPLPPRDDEVRVLTRHAEGFDPRDLAAAGIRPVAGVDDLAAGRAAVRDGRDRARGGGLRRRPGPGDPRVAVAPARRLPARGHRALSAARAWAWLSGRDYVTPDDVKALARPALRHRVELRPEAELEGVTPDGVLEGVLAAVPVPR